MPMESLLIPRKPRFIPSVFSDGFFPPPPRLRKSQREGTYTGSGRREVRMMEMERFGACSGMFL